MDTSFLADILDNDDLCVKATYTNARGVPYDMLVAFQEDDATDIIGETSVSSRSPLVTAREADVPGCDQSCTFMVDGILYHVLEVKPFATGILEIQISRDQP